MNSHSIRLSNKYIDLRIYLYFLITSLHAQSALLSINELDMVLFGRLVSMTLNVSSTVKDGRHKDAT